MSERRGVDNDAVYRLICAGKHRHATMEGALTELGRSKKRSKKAGKKMLKIQAYRCQVCGGYHVDHRNKGRK